MPAHATAAKVRFLFILVIGCGLGHAFAKPPPANTLTAPRANAVDTAVRAEMQKQNVVGMAVGVIEDGHIVYLQGYGFADREKKLPVTTATMFRWASCSKMLTAIAAMQLHEHGKLDLEADVRHYVPEFPDKGVKITPHELLDHQGGIVHYDNGKIIQTKAKYTTPHPFEDVVTALNTFKESPLVNAPGEAFSYSTHGFMLLSAIVQRAGNEKFADQVRDRIIHPLGMKTLQPDYQWIDIPNRASGYVEKGDLIEPSSNTDVSWKLGGGGYISDIGDFARFAVALIDHELVSATTEKAMWTQQTLKNGKVTDWGLGFEINDPESHLKASHGGSQEKTRTRLVVYPHDRSGVVIMTNSEWVDPGHYSTLVFKALARK